jgi:hypothetical protein
MSIADRQGLFEHGWGVIALYNGRPGTAAPVAAGHACMQKQRWLRVMAMLLAGMAALHAALGWKFREQVKAGYGDFVIFYAAGNIVGSGAGHRLYDPALQYRAELPFAPEVREWQRALPYNHPPFEAWLFVPLARLRYFPAYCLWLAINLVIVGGIEWLLRSEVELVGKHSLWFWEIASLGFFPVFLSLLQGQDVLLLVLLYVLSYRALKRGAEWKAGTWLGAGLFRPQGVLPLLIVLALRKRWRVLGGAAAVAGVLGAISIATVGWSEAIRFPAAVMQMEREGGGAPEPADMPNVRGVAAMLRGATGNSAGSRASDAMVLAVSIALLVWVSTKWRERPPGAEWDLGFALSVVATVLASYHGYVYDLSLLALPILLVAEHAKNETDQPASWMIWVPMSLLMFTPLYLLMRLRWHAASFVVLLMVVWMVGILRELKRIQRLASE